MTSRQGYVTMWHRRLLVRVGHKKTTEIIKMKTSMSRLGAAGSNGLTDLQILCSAWAKRGIKSIQQSNENFSGN